MAITYFVTLPFDRDEEGELVAGETREAQTDMAERRIASAMAEAKRAPSHFRARAIHHRRVRGCRDPRALRRNAR
jgi:hypothetical protein